MNLRRSGNLATLPLLTKRPSSGPQSIALTEESFHRMIALERKRTERSRNPFLLMLLETGDSLESDDAENLLRKALSTLSDSIRETDVSGWYKGSSVVGVMFTQLGSGDRTATVSMMSARVSATLRTALGAEQFSQVNISFHLFPEDSDHGVSDRPSNPALYPDLLRRDQARKLSSVVKRMMDVAGGALALAAFAPLFLVIAVAIKLSSKGPVFFRQQRIGQYGVPFVFLKFRSMYANNDASVQAG